MCYLHVDIQLFWKFLRVVLPERDRTLSEHMPAHQCLFQSRSKKAASIQSCQTPISSKYRPPSGEKEHKPTSEPIIHVREGIGTLMLGHASLASSQGEVTAKESGTKKSWSRHRCRKPSKVAPAHTVWNTKSVADMTHLFLSFLHVTFLLCSNIAYSVVKMMSSVDLCASIIIIV